MAPEPQSGSVTVVSPGNESSTAGQPTQARLPADDIVTSGSAYALDRGATLSEASKAADAPNKITSTPLILNHDNNHASRDDEKYTNATLDNTGSDTTDLGTVEPDGASPNSVDPDGENLELDPEIDLDDVQVMPEQLDEANLQLLKRRARESPINHGFPRSETGTLHSSLHAYGRSSPSPRPNGNNDLNTPSEEVHGDEVFNGIGKWM